MTSALSRGPRPRSGAAFIRRAALPKSSVGSVGVLSITAPCAPSVRSVAMTVKTEAARGTLTYSRMRGMVAILIGEFRNKTGLLGFAKWKIFEGPASD